MMRLTLGWSGVSLWIPDSWIEWVVDGVQFRRTERGLIQIAVGDEWHTVRDGWAEPGFAMPRSA